MQHEHGDQITRLHDHELDMNSQEAADQCSPSPQSGGDAPAASSGAAAGDAVAPPPPLPPSPLPDAPAIDQETYTSRRLRAGAAPPKLAYIEHLARLAPQSNLTLGAQQGRRLPANVRPSMLQLKQRQGGHDLASVLRPLPTPDGLSFVGFENNPATGRLQLSEGPAAGASQFRFELVRASAVGPTGFAGQRAPLRATARVGLLDRQRRRFLGNIHEMRTAEVGGDGSKWTWRADGANGGGGAAVVRCDEAQPDPARGTRAVGADRVVLLVELNVAFRLTAEDAGALPAREERAAGLVDELTTCWAMISFGRCAALPREMEITVVSGCSAD
jgi:hypothetical protein